MTSSPGCARRTTAWWWATPTAARTARSTASATSSACARLPGLHCYDLYAGASRIEQFLADQPGTYLLTDFLVRSFARTVEQELGLDRWPELRDDYFGHYTRVVWLAQEPTAELRALAEDAASRIGLPLTVVETGDGELERALAELWRIVPDVTWSGTRFRHDFVRTIRPAATSPADPYAMPRSRRPG